MNRYERLAEAAGVRLCTDFDCAWRGGLEPGTVHWTYARYTNRAALAFLMEAYWASSHPDASSLQPPRWLARYERVMWMNATARKAGARLPRSVWEMDRARMREDLSRYAARTTPRSRPPEYGRAVRWAERKGDRS